MFGLVPVQLFHNSTANCETTAARINGHPDYDGPDMKCPEVRRARCRRVVCAYVWDGFKGGCLFALMFCLQVTFFHSLYSYTNDPDPIPWHTLAAGVR